MKGQELISPCTAGRSWVYYSKRELTPGFSVFKKKVFLRDHSRCYHCGFVGNSHMKVMNRDGNYRNNKLSNLYTVCPLCFWSCFLDYSGCGGAKRGVLLYLPEISQSNLNGLMHSLFCSISASTSHEQIADEIQKDLRLRSKAFEQAYGEGRSDPMVFCQMYMNSQLADSDQSRAILKDIRWMPLMTGFAEEIKQWSIESANS